jgi:hypothetical protein
MGVGVNRLPSYWSGESLTGRHLKLVLLTSVVFIIILIVVSIWPWRGARDSYSAADKFASAIERNKVSTARRVTSADQWERLDALFTDREAVSCPWFAEDRSGPWSLDGGGGTDGDMVERHYDVIISRPCPDWQNSYCLEIEDVIVRKVENRWFVVDWKQVDERWQVGVCYFGVTD